MEWASELINSYNDKNNYTDLTYTESDLKLSHNTPNAVPLNLSSDEWATKCIFWSNDNATKISIELEAWTCDAWAEEQILLNSSEFLEKSDMTVRSEIDDYFSETLKLLDSIEFLIK